MIEGNTYEQTMASITDEDVREAREALVTNRDQYLLPSQTYDWDHWVPRPDHYGAAESARFRAEVKALADEELSLLKGALDDLVLWAHDVYDRQRFRYDRSICIGEQKYRKATR